MALTRARLLGFSAAPCALSLAVFWPIREHAFLNYDDDHYITRSAGLALGPGAAGLVWAATSFDGANWFPLTRLSWMLDRRLFGELQRVVDEVRQRDRELGRVRRARLDPGIDRRER